MVNPKELNQREFKTKELAHAPGHQQEGACRDYLVSFERAGLRFPAPAANAVSSGAWRSKVRNKGQDSEGSVQRWRNHNYIVACAASGRAASF